jgi:hypothetical protein
MFFASHDPRMLIFLGVFCLCYGGYHVYRGGTAGPLRRVTAAELEEGKVATQGTWFEIVGVPRWDLQLAEDDKEKGRRVVPLVSRGWTAERPVAVFMELGSSDPNRRVYAGGVVAGTRVVGRGLGSAFASRYLDRGIRTTRDVLLIGPGGSPVSMINEGQYVMMAGIAALLVYRPLMWVMRRSEPKRRVIEVRRSGAQ